MNNKKVGFVGWRGIVGSVLMNRMIEENNFQNIHLNLFSTSQNGQIGPTINSKSYILNDAYNLEHLIDMDIIISCQGGDYTNIIYKKLRFKGWNGYWIDAASTLRMDKESIIVLDPINLNSIYDALNNGIKTFIGGNCTVSLMLMALGGLFDNHLVDWIIFSTYQAASGAGSKYIVELLKQMGYLHNTISEDLYCPITSILDIDSKICRVIHSNEFPKKHFGVSLAGNVLPWIDTFMNNLQTREEWKVQAEANKILNTKQNILIDGTCVRVGTFRCHSQSFFIKLNKNLSYSNLVEIIKNHNRWINVIPNNYQSTINMLTPMSVAGTLDIAVGRIRKLNLSSNMLSIFTVGDQLLWGAAEPLRRMLMILINS